MDEFNIVYLSPKEELSFLEEELSSLQELRESSYYNNPLSIQHNITLDKVVKQLTLKIINCKEFIEELKIWRNNYE